MLFRDDPREGEGGLVLVLVRPGAGEGGLLFREDPREGEGGLVLVLVRPGVGDGGLLPVLVEPAVGGVGVGEEGSVATFSTDLVVGSFSIEPCFCCGASYSLVT